MTLNSYVNKASLGIKEKLIKDGGLMETHFSSLNKEMVRLQCNFLEICGELTSKISGRSINVMSAASSCSKMARSRAAAAFWNTTTASSHSASLLSGARFFHEVAGLWGTHCFNRKFPR